MYFDLAAPAEEMSGLAKRSGAVMRTEWRGRWLRPRQATPVQPDSIGSWPFAEARIHTIHVSVSRLGGIGPLLPVGGHGSSPLTLSANGGLDPGLCHLQTDAGPAVAARAGAMKVARYTAMLHVAFLKRGPGRARTDGRQGRPKPTSERDFMRPKNEAELSSCESKLTRPKLVSERGRTAAEKLRIR